MRRRGAASLLRALAAATVLTGATGVDTAAAALPGGAIAVASGPAAQPTGIVAGFFGPSGWFAVTDDPTRPTSLVKADGTSTVYVGPTPAKTAMGSGTVSCADMVVSIVEGGLAWRDLSTGAAGIADAHGMLVSAAPHGWIERVAYSSLVRVDASTGARTVLGSVPVTGQSTSSAACDATHFAIESGGGVYIGAFASPGVTELRAPSDFLSFDVLAVAGDTVAYRYQQRPPSTWGSVVVRQQVGADPQDLLNSSVAAAAAWLAPDATYIGIGGGVWRYATPWDRSSVAGLATGTVLSVTVVGSEVLVGATDGLWRGTPTGADKIWTPPQRGIVATAIDLGPGRVTWAEGAGGPLRQRAFGIGSPPPLGAVQGPSMTTTYMRYNPTLPISGRRFLTNMRPDVYVWDGESVAHISSESAWITRMWAHRVVAANDTSLFAHDLVSTGTVRRPGGVNGSDASAFWEDELIVGTAAAGVTAHDLLTGATRVLATVNEVGLAGDNRPVETVAAGADYVAWAAPTSAGVGPVTRQITWMNLHSRVQGSVTIGPWLRADTLAFYGSQLLIHGANTRGDIRTIVIDLATGQTILDHATTWQTPPDQRMTSPTLDQGVLAWIAGSGEPMIATMPHQAIAPRHEGNPFAAPDYWPDLGALWHSEWVFTESLRTCTVAIRSAAGVTVRTLPCASAYAGQGEAVVDWDGRDDTGALVPAGSYTWTVVGGDEDGAATDVGGAGPVTGPLTVRRGAPSGFVPVPPARVLDTRVDGATADGISAGIGSIGPNASRQIQIAGRAGIPATGAAAYVLNVTGVDPTTSTYLTVWPPMSPRPLASNLNLGAREVNANAVIVSADASGGISVYNAAGSSDVLVDVVGYFPQGSSPTFVGVDPARLTDTRPAGATIDNQQSGTGAIGPLTDRAVPVAGRGGIPSSGVAAVVANLTGIEPTQSSYLTLHPSGTSGSDTSTLNLPRGSVRPNLAVVPLGSQGEALVYNRAGLTDAALDVQGYFPTGGGLSAMTPTRLLDTRSSSPLGPGGTRTVQVAGVAGIPADATSVVVNLTGVDPTAGTYLSAYAAGSPRPGTSTLNLPAADVRANLAIVQLGSGGAMTLFNAAGSCHALVDVVGWLR